MKKISLGGPWKLYYYPSLERSISHPDQLEEQKIPFVPAAVPGNVELDLANAGMLPKDLFFGDNVRLVRKYELYEWWYVTEFESSPEKGRKIDLCFQGVDCFAQYWLNGEILGESDNMFVENRFDITGKTSKTGKNTLVVRIRPALPEAAKKSYDPLMTYTWGKTMVDHIWVRKAAHSYGWDIMPRVVSAGLWRPVSIEIRDSFEIRDLYFMTAALENGRAKMNLHYELEVPDEFLLEKMYLELDIAGGGQELHLTHSVFFKCGVVFFELEDPMLWWPKGYGEQPFYSAQMKLMCHGKILAQTEREFAVRMVNIDHSDQAGQERFLIQVNGEPILCKGTNWVPLDAFHSRDGERLERALELVDDIGCNMIRCWGGNVYENQAFFTYCDRKGIMVWQDFAMACACYPQDPEFLEKIKKEATAVIRSLRHHPSLILWAGDNECDTLMLSRGINPNLNQITRRVLPEAVFQCDPIRFFYPSSPYVTQRIFEGQGKMPEDHLWGPRDYYKGRYYAENGAMFASEIGYHGCPGLSSLKKFLEKDKLWPWQGNEQWILHSTDQDNDPYRIQLLSDQIKELFGEVPDAIEDYIAASQISQAEAKKFFIENTRLKKWKKSGIIWWNLLDGWPQFSDAVVDYFFAKKLAYYYIKRVQTPICISIAEPENWGCQAVVCNDSRKEVSGTYRIWDGDSKQTLLEGKFCAAANENTLLGKIRLAHSDQRLLLICWNIDGADYANHYIAGYPPLSLERYKGWLEKIQALPEAFSKDALWQ